VTEVLPIPAREHEAFCRRELRLHRYAYWFVDGIHASVRLAKTTDSACSC
jgi:hypothetical protein